jgi:hypothetical protein
MGMFKADVSGLRKFCMELGKLPALLRRAESQTLNDMAFNFKAEAEKSIIENLMSRRPEFVRRVFRVEKSSADTLQATAGTVQLDNSAFTGFTEQLGKPDQRVRAPTLAGRGGQARNILPRTSRMMKGAKFPNINELDGNIPVAGRLDLLDRRGVKRFVMTGPDAAPFSEGLYEFTGELTERGKPKVKMLQNFKKPAQPRRFDFIAAAMAKITQAVVDAIHGRNVMKELQKMKRNF